MSRDEGFAVADVATTKHTDPKFRALWRLLRDEQAMNAAVVLYEAVQLASWQHGDRLSAEDAAPAWMSDVEAPRQALSEVGLLDTQGRLPAHAWAAWFGPAVERREGLRERWRRANRRRGKAATPTLPRGDSGGTATPVRPSVRPSDRTDKTGIPSDKGAASAGMEHVGSKNRYDEEALLASYREKAANPELSEDIRRAAALEVERREAARVH